MEMEWQEGWIPVQEEIREDVVTGVVTLVVLPDCMEANEELEELEESEGPVDF